MEFTFNVGGSGGNGEVERSSEAPSSPSSEPPAAAGDRFERLIREIDRLERGGAFVWVGFLAKNRLPQLGYSADEVNALLNDAIDEGIVTVKDVPSPKNPQFRAREVRLERTHSLVRAALTRQAGNGGSTYVRPKVRGEPVSETIIRERR